MPKKVILIHDSYTNPQTGWYLWLQTELPRQGVAVYAPKLPTPIGQSFMSWNVLFSAYREHLGPETIIIGHGTGALFALRVLESATTQVGGAILVAPYVEALPNQGMTMISQTFLAPDIAWEKVHRACNQFAVIAASNDPFIPLPIAQHVAELCGIPITTISHEGHFLTEQSTFPEIITALTHLAKPLSDSEKSLQKLQKELAYTGITFDASSITASNNDDTYLATEVVKGSTSFYDDVKRTITTGEAESMSKLLETERLKEEEKKESHNRFILNSIFLALGLVFLAVGGYLFLRKDTVLEIPLQSLRDSSPLRASSIIPVLIPNDKVSAVLALENAITKTRAASGDVVLISPTDATQKPLGFLELMDTIESKIPVSLRQTVNGYILGFLEKEQPEPFLLLSVDSFDAGYAGMREWESSMVIDLYRILVPSDRGFTREGLENTTFTDTTAQNKQVRVVSLPRKVSVVKEFVTTETLLQSDLPTTYIYKNEWKPKKTDTTWTFTPSLPNDLLLLKKSDIIIIPSSGNQLASILKVTDVTTTADNVLVNYLPGEPSDLYIRQTIEKGYEQKTDSNGVVTFVKTTKENKTVLEDAPNENALYTTFLNNKILIITTDLDVINELVRRLSTAALFK